MVPSQMSLRRIPDDLHLKVRVAYAAAWEALIDTHTRQAQEFVCEFAPRLPVLESLDLFFRIIPVPEAMQESVRCRALTGLDIESIQPLTRRPKLSGWRRFRPDLVLEFRRWEHRYQQRTLELARMVGSRVAEAVVGTHVENAVEFAFLLKGVMPVNDATDHYLGEFRPLASLAQMVKQRVQARVAGDELSSQYDEVPPVLEAPPETQARSEKAALPTPPLRSFELPGRP
ncbi:MAG TPA: hypothetical protein VFN96_09035 [Gemmatimonadales bacterium]|nr:hypothetical protein [Gemmatimonadales bacterium]